MENNRGLRLNHEEFKNIVSLCSTIKMAIISRNKSSKLPFLRLCAIFPLLFSFVFKDNPSLYSKQDCQAWYSKGSFGKLPLVMSKLRCLLLMAKQGYKPEMNVSISSEWFSSPAVEAAKWKMVNSGSLLLRGPSNFVTGVKITRENWNMSRIPAHLAERARRWCLTIWGWTGSLPEGTKTRKHEWRHDCWWGHNRGGGDHH